MGRVLVGVVVFAVFAAQSRAVEQKAIDKAIDDGVAALRKSQQSDGTWRHGKVGATALAGLTLLECGVDKDDKAVKKAAAKVREAALTMTDTYSLSLSVLFLDRLDTKTDTSLIESMLVQLLGGQMANGGWGYECPRTPEVEVRRIKTETDTTRDLSTLPAKGKRKATDLPKEIRARLLMIARAAATGGLMVSGSDNSNTQFATLATWVGRRYGMPAQGTLLAVDRYFRAQQFKNGSWAYTPMAAGIAGAPAGFVGDQGPSAAMTCAGLLGLAVGHGANLDIKKARDPKAEPSDVSKDKSIALGLQALGTAIGKPTGWSGLGASGVKIDTASGKAFYMLWSLERVAVAYNLETIGKKDWYQRVAEILLTSQQRDGSWVGEYGACGADTCFALLFLKRVNFTRDLSAGMRGGRGIDTVLKAGGVGGSGLKGSTFKGLASPDIGKAKPKESNETKAPERPRAKPRTPEEAAVARVTDDLVKAKGERRSALLKKLRDGKGVEYTEALAGVISRLDVEGRSKAREALADRLTRMKATTLREYFKDDDAEIRRAAALAAAQQDSKILTPDLIRLLSDPQSLVERAAYAALKELSGKDFGPRSGADRAEKAKAIAAWQVWWKKKARE